MLQPRRKSRISANPTLVGAIASIIAIVAVFFSYNAHLGLPFVPTYRINAELPSGASLVEGNEVRIAGVRVGIVSSIKPKQLDSGRTIADLKLKLDKSVQPVPDNSTITVRQRSAMGLKYLLLTPGDSSEGIDPGGTIPLAQAKPETVDMDQWFNMFQPDVRESIQHNLAQYGGMFAARGDSINEILGELPPLLKVAEPVTRNLSSKQTDLEGFIKGLGQAAAEVVPVADQQAEMFVALNTTFDALAEVARPYMQDSITEGVKTQLVVQKEAPRIRPFLDTSARFMKAFLPGAKALGESAPIVRSSFDVGIPVLNSSPRLYNELGPTARSLRQFSESTQVNQGVDTLIKTVKILRPLMDQVGPAQNVCNYLALTLRNVAEVHSKGQGDNRWVRAITVFGPLGPNAEAVPAAAPASGGGATLDDARKNYLHTNLYPWTAAKGEPRACAAGNEIYLPEQTVIGNSMDILAKPVYLTDGQTQKQLNWRKGE